MKPIIFVTYTDALYYTKENLEYTGFKENFAIGKLISNENNHITISFTEKNGNPESGLLIPKRALILSNEKNTRDTENLGWNFKIGDDIGIYWNDIAYYAEGKIYDKCPIIYTEGKLFSITPDAVILKNPETLMVNKKNIKNHPSKKPFYYIIPKSLITNIELYDK